MNNTNKLICSLFAIIAVTFLLGTAVASITNDSNASNYQTNDTYFEVTGFDDEGTLQTATAENLSDAVTNANEFISLEYTDVTITATATWNTNEKVTIPENVDFIINDGVTLTLSGEGKITVGETSTITVDGTLSLSGGQLALFDKRNIDAKNGSIVVDSNSLNLITYTQKSVGTVKWIGYGAQIEPLNGTNVTVKTVGDSETGHEFGTTVMIGDMPSDKLGCRVRDIIIDESSSLIIPTIDRVYFENALIRDGGKLIVGENTMIGPSALEGDALINGRHDSADKLTIKFPGEMRIAEGTTITLGDDRTEYKMDTLVVDGTLVLKKEIEIGSTVYISGDLVLADRDYLCPIDDGSEIVVELEGLGLITLKEKNKWYGYGGALEPAQPSDVSLKIIRDGDDVKYVFEIKGFAYVNLVDEYSIFDLRDIDEISTSTGFILINGFAQLNEDTIFSVTDKGAVAFTRNAHLTIGDKVYVGLVSENAKFTVYGCVLTEDELKEIETVIGNEDYFLKFQELGIDTGLIIAKNNGSDYFNINAFGKASTSDNTDGITIREDVVFKAMGEFKIENGGKVTVLEEGTFEVEGSLSINGTLDNNGEMNVKGPIAVTGEDSKYIPYYEDGKAHLLVGDENAIFSITGTGSIVFFSTAKNDFIIIADNEEGDSVSLNYDENGRKIVLETAFMLIGYSYEKLDKEKEFLGITSNDLTALNKIFGEYTEGTMVIDGNLVDITGKSFLVVEGSATFEIGSTFMSAGNKVVGVPGDSANFILPYPTTKLVITPYAMPQDVLDILIKNDSNTSYKNVLFAKSYELVGYGSVNNFYVDHNMALKIDITQTKAENITVVGDVYTNDGTFIGKGGIFEFETTKSIIRFSSVDAKVMNINIKGHVILNGVLSQQNSEDRLYVFAPDDESEDTLFTIKGKLEFYKNRTMVDSERCVIRIAEGGSVTCDTVDFVGDTNAITTIHAGAYVDIKKNENDGIDIHSIGYVTVNEGKSLDIWARDALKVTDDEEGGSFTVLGTFFVHKSESLTTDNGSVCVEYSATMTIGDSVLFGNENDALMSIGETAHVHFYKHTAAEGFIIQVVGGDDEIGEKDVLKLNDGKKLTIGEKDGLVIVDANFVVGINATLVIENTNNVAVAITSSNSDPVLPSIIGYGGEQGSCSTIIINGLVEFNTFDSNGKPLGFSATGGIKITTNKLIEPERKTLFDDITKFGYANKAILAGDVARSTECKIAAGNVVEIVANPAVTTESSLTLNDSITVSGELVVKSQNVSMKVKGGFKTAGDGKITLYGDSNTKLTISDVIIIGDNGYFILGGNSTVTAKTTKAGGFDVALTGGSASLVKEFHIDVNDSISIMSNTTLTLKSTVTIGGTLAINGGTLVTSNGEYLNLVREKGSWKASNGATVEVQGIKITGTDGMLMVTESGTLSFSLDENGTTVLTLIGETKVLKDFEIPTKLRFMNLARLSVEKDATLTIKSPELVVYEKFAYVSLAIGAEYYEGTTKLAGPDGDSVFKTSGEDGRLTFIYTNEYVHTGMGLLLSDGKDNKGITVEIMSNYKFNTIRPVTVDPYSTFRVGENVDVSVSGAKFEIKGTLIVDSKATFVVDTAMHFFIGSIFVFNDKEIVGPNGFNVTAGEVKITIDKNKYLTVYTCGNIHIEEGVTIEVSQSLKLNMYDRESYVVVKGTLIAEEKYTKYVEHPVHFYPGSTFTIIKEDMTEYNMIGTDGAIKLVYSDPGLKTGDLTMKYNKETDGFDMSLFLNVLATVQKDFTIRDIDTFVVGASSILKVDAKLNVDCEMIKINGQLWIGDGDIVLAEGSSIALDSGASLKEDTVLMIGEKDDGAHITMKGGDGIVITDNGKGWNYDVKSYIIMNFVNGGLKLDGNDTFVIENGVAIFGTLTIPTMGQVTLMPGVETELRYNESDETFHAAIVTEDEGIIIANHSDALFNVMKQKTIVTFIHKENGTDLVVKEGSIRASKNLTMEGDSSITVEFNGTFSVKKNTTLNVSGNCTLLYGSQLEIIGEMNVTGDLLINSGSYVIYHDTLIVGTYNDAWISVNSTDDADGFIKFVRKDMRMVCNGIVAVNEKMIVPAGYKLSLEECQFEVYGTVEFLGECAIDMNSSSISFFVGAQLSENVATEEHVIIGTDNDNADYSISGVRSSTSKLYIATDSEFGTNGRFIMSGEDEHFTLTANKPYTIIPAKTIVVEKDAKLVIKDCLVLGGSVIVKGDLLFDENADMEIIVGGNMHIFYGATVFDGEEELIGYDRNENAHTAVVELGDDTTSIYIVGISGGFEMTMEGHTVINEGKTLNFPDKCKLIVAGELDVNGMLTVENGIKAIPFEPNYPVAIIKTGENSTFVASIDGTVELSGYLGNETLTGVKGDVKLIGDITINGYFGIDGNLILNGCNIIGTSSNAYVRGAIVLDGLNSHQLDQFEGTIRVHQYYDGPMLYIANGKINDKWNVDVEITYGPGVTEKPVPFFTKDNKFDGFAFVNVTLGEFQKATLKIVEGQGEVVKISDGVWHVYSSGFDVKCELEIEEEAAPVEKTFSDGEIALIALALIIILLLAYCVYRLTKGKAAATVGQVPQKQCEQPVVTETSPKEEDKPKL